MIYVNDMTFAGWKMKGRVVATIEGAEKAVKEVKKEAALKYLFSQEIDFASWEEEKEGLTNQRIKDIEAAAAVLLVNGLEGIVSVDKVLGEIKGLKRFEP